MRVDSCQILLPDFVRWLKVERDTTDSTLKHHLCNLRNIFRRVTSFNEESSRNFIFEIKQEFTSGTIEKYIYTMRVFCEYLIYRGLLKSNWGMNIPFPKHVKKVPVILTVTEIECILAQNLPQSYRNYKDPESARRMFDSIFEILARTGARVGELLNIKPSDINWIEKTWTLNDTKTRIGRVIPLPDDSVKVLESLARNPDDLIFTNPRSGGRINATVICRNFRQRLEATGVRKKATIHSLRHSFIVEMFKQDVSPLKIANIVGHENIKTTQDYARLLVEDLRDAMMRHPMTAKNRNPYDIIKQIKDNVEHFRLKEDSRFFYELSDANDGIRISVFIR